MEICDMFPAADDGNFLRADLWLTELPTNYADLSLSKNVSTASPAFGATITYTLQVTNAASSPQTATGVVVNDLLPTGTSFAPLEMVLTSAARVTGHSLPSRRDKREH